jgi:tetratricopeptide (TPR) repeat protein
MRGELLTRLIARLETFKTTQDPEAVTCDEAIKLAQQLWDSVDNPATDLEIMTALGWLSWYRYLSLPKAVGYGDHLMAETHFALAFRDHPEALPHEIRKRFDSIGPNHQNRLMVLSRRGMQLLDQALETGDLATLEAAIATTEEVVARIGAADINRTVALSRLGNTLIARYERTGQLPDLDRAIELWEEALAIPGGGQKRAKMLFNLGNALLARYERTGQFADLDRAVELGEVALAIPGTDVRDRPRMLSDLGRALHTRYWQTQQFADLDRCLEVGEQAVVAADTHNPKRAMLLSNYAAALLTRFGQTRQIDDLDKCVEVGEHALACESADPSDHAATMSNLARALFNRFDRTGHLVDLDRAIYTGEQALLATGADDPTRAMTLTNLGAALRTRFQETGRLTDLARSVDVCDQAVAATGADHPDQRAVCLANLGSALHNRNWQTGQLMDLSRAVEAFDQALAVGGTDHADRAGMLSALGNVLCTVYRRTGQVKDLNRAVEVSEQALAVAGTDHSDHTDHSEHLFNFGNALLTRYGRTGQLLDLERALEVTEKAVSALGEDDRIRAMYLSAHGSALITQYKRSGKLTDLDRAVEVTERAAASSGDGDINYAPILGAFAAVLMTRYERAEQIGDLDRAIEVSEQAAAAAGADHPDHAICLTNHAGVLRTRYGRTRHIVDLERAVEVAEQALATTGDDDPNRAIYMYSLGETWRDRYEGTGQQADLDRAERLFREASRVVSAPPIDRVRAARSWALAAQVSDWGQAVEGYTQAVELLGQVAPRWLGRDDQEHWLAEFAGIGRDAVAACLQANLPERAVGLFEQGRGVLFAQALDSRTDVSALGDAHPELAQEFIRLTGELDGDDSRHVGQPLIMGKAGALATRPGDAEWRQRAGADLQALLGAIRSTAGFDTFMHPGPIGELLQAAGDGPVVLINVARVRSDALILGPTGVDVVSLPGLDPDTAVEKTNKFFLALGDALDRKGDPATWYTAEAELSDVLAWLWDRVTGPVLDRLRLTSRPGKDQLWTHVHWCPSGPLAALPLQAAGRHETRFDLSPATVIDRVISSTIPTVRALTDARRQTTTPRLAGGRFDSRGLIDDGRVLAVAMPSTPHQGALPGSAKEAEFIRDLIPGRVDILGLPGTPSATHESVAAALPTHSWAHFSCHGANDPRFPSASHILLEDYQTHPLTVLDVSRARLQDVDFAFLSACTTGLTGTAMPDESIHLASAFQIAGYRHVIATLWPIDDVDAVLVTQIVYEYLAADGKNSRADKAAAALHNATRILRSFHTEEPSRWAAHTHTGP